TPRNFLIFGPTAIAVAEFGHSALDSLEGRERQILGHKAIRQVGSEVIYGLDHSSFLHVFFECVSAARPYGSEKEPANKDLKRWVLDRTPASTSAMCLRLNLLRVAQHV